MGHNRQEIAYNIFTHFGVELTFQIVYYIIGRGVFVRILRNYKHGREENDYNGLENE